MACFERVKEMLFGEATKPGPCQVRSKTESPCPRPAVVEIRGIPFCGPCAREQEAYFAIGELTGTQGSRGKPLAEVLGRMQRERPGGNEGIAAETHHGLEGVGESEQLALRGG
jgi:hypothetical protein